MSLLKKLKRNKGQSCSMKGAVNIISIVLIAGIVISLVSAAYIWSTPLLEKGETNTAFQSATSFAFSLNNNIISVANSGGGEGSMNTPPGMFVTIVPETAENLGNNSIILQIAVPQAMALSDGKTYLGGASFTDIIHPDEGVFGESSPSIISFEVEPMGTGHIATFQILFRRLATKTTPIKKFKIALNRDSTDVLKGGDKITYSFAGTETVGKVTFTKINVGVA